MAIIGGYSSASLLGAAIILSVAALIIRRYFFHPLSKYPGPFWSAVSDVPVAASLLTGKNHIHLKQLHDKYGPVVRVAPNELSFCSPQAYEDIYGFRSYDEPMEKDPIWIGALMTMNGEVGISYAPRDVHARQRRAFSHPLSNSSIMQQEPLIQEHMHRLIARLGDLEAAGKPANFTDWYSFTSLDVISDLYVGTPFGCLTSGDGQQWLDALEKGMQCGVYEQVTRRLAGSHTWLQKKLYQFVVPTVYKQGKMTHFLKSKQKVMERIQDEQSDHKDFMYYILRNNEAKNLLTPTEILLNSATFIAAGGDTTAAALAAITYCLLTHPDTYETLKAEIRGRCKTQQDIVHDNIKGLPYLGAIIREGMRLHTPVVIGSLRQVPPHGQGALIDGNFVPAGVTVSIPQWTATHSELNWTRPYEFLPERWLHPEKFPGDRPQAAQPFSLGPRGCIGKNLSWMEMRLVLCHVLWAFDLELEGGRQGVWKWDPDGDVKHVKAYMMFQRPELWVRLKKVQR
ncbi:Cytochrome P450 monooxygenase abl2 [Podospora aff. communis PSN243]|uniref:Cytochrome P450 monooxygenase abl2 n=1 Tax=Podospora aff. communis PSN243 TaxID=3040156 RepID=A0AAV9G1Q8_9PEZI|nr:Cytochrome P450 monooxygenase abl2 [Podospora aff. communis PSN243]